MRNIQHTLESRPVLKRMILLVGALIVILLCTFALSTLATAKHTQAAARGTQTTYESICISSGDSLWSIAQEYSNVEMYADYDAYISEVKQLNHMTGEDIHSGQYLIVPYYTADLK